MTDRVESHLSPGECLGTPRLPWSGACSIRRGQRFTYLSPARHRGIPFLDCVWIATADAVTRGDETTIVADFYAHADAEEA